MFHSEGYIFAVKAAVKLRGNKVVLGSELSGRGGTAKFWTCISNLAHFRTCEKFQWSSVYSVADKETEEEERKKERTRVKPKAAVDLKANARNKCAA